MTDPEATRQKFVACNMRTLEWMLNRGVLHGGFLNTKVNSITLKDYTDADGWRGPGYTYGWIQGRGLEALATHAAFFADEHPALGIRLDVVGRTLYSHLARLFDQGGSHLYFCYDADFTPIIRGAAGTARPQRAAQDLFTYSDVFALKGLLTAAARYGDNDGVTRYLTGLEHLVAAIYDGRFRPDEHQPLTPETPPPHDEFGPWMIVLGVAGVVRRLGLLDRLGSEAQTAFSGGIVETILDRFWSGQARTGTDLIPDWRGGHTANPGHALEFVGFALESLGPSIDRTTLAALERIFNAAFAAGFLGPGIVLSVEAATGRPLSPNCPWWSLPETIRAAALLHEQRGDNHSATVWKQADDAFFGRYWRNDPPLAYQMLTPQGPVDVVPATPDLDPGYHTGLSLLGAIEAMDRKTGRPATHDLKGPTP